MGEKYEYTALGESKDAIRILRILPSAQFKDPLICSLTTASLDTNPQYIALSYTWGAPVRVTNLILHGHHFPITANLSTALRRLREAKWQMVWVDAVCINQDDTEERSLQVLSMKRIYQQALHVCVYLGEDRVMGRSPLANALDLFLKPSKRANPNFGFNDLMPPMRDAWIDAFSRPWFSRVWVLQEATASTNTFLICGKFGIPFDVLIRGVFIEQAKLDYLHLSPASMNATTLQAIEQGIQGVAIITKIKSSRDQQAPIAFLDLLEMCRSCNATDPRDKIYALLGLMPDIEGLPKPDYGLDVKQVYHKYAHFLLSQGVGADILHSAGRSRAVLQLPSWVPDWSFHSGTLEHWTRVVKAWGDRQLQASGDFEPSIKVNDDDSNNLMVQGSMIDSILALGPEMESRRWTNARNFLAWDEASRALIESHELQTEPLSERWWEIYCLTLIMGCIPTDRTKIKKPVEDYGRMTERLHRGETIASQEGSSTPYFSRLTVFSGQEDADLEAIQYHKYVQQFTYRRRICVTCNGFVGLVPGSVIEGDQIAVILGGGTPFILREVEDAHLLIGDAYFHGLMRGEALEMDEFVLQDISLV